ncbi:hypothetical protein K4F52_010366 [Lecanicillium sp. MT-2017a]|nr:hypothetical protein K4F52_010366 [Lecanicillium sp. MT-2017a]
MSSNENSANREGAFQDDATSWQMQLNDNTAREMTQRGNSSKSSRGETPYAQSSGATSAQLIEQGNNSQSKRIENSATGFILNTYEKNK